MSAGGSCGRASCADVSFLAGSTPAAGPSLYGLRSALRPPRPARDPRDSTLGSANNSRAPSIRLSLTARMLPCRARTASNENCPIRIPASTLIPSPGHGPCRRHGPEKNLFRLKVLLPLVPKIGKLPDAAGPFRAPIAVSKMLFKLEHFRRGQALQSAVYKFSPRRILVRTIL